MSGYGRHLRVFVCATLLLPPLVIGCGGDDDGPAGPSTPTTAQVGGAWTYAFSNITGSSGTTNVTCSTNNVSLDINQTGTTFTGSYFAPSMSCTGPGGTFSDGPYSGTIVNGSVGGTSVSFDFDTSDWNQAGSVSGNSMNGTVAVNLQVDASQLMLSGNWSAAKTSNVIIHRSSRPLKAAFEARF